MAINVHNINKTRAPSPTTHNSAIVVLLLKTVFSVHTSPPFDDQRSGELGEITKHPNVFLIPIIGNQSYTLNQGEFYNEVEN